MAVDEHRLKMCWRANFRLGVVAWGGASPMFFRVLKSLLTDGFSKVYASPCTPRLQTPKTILLKGIEKYISQQI